MVARGGDYDRSEDWRAEGFVNAASALRVKCSMNQGVADRHLRLARRLRDLPVVAEAFAAGELSRQHVEPIVDAWTAERAPELAEVEDAIVHAAKIATPQQVGAIMRHLSGAIDGDDGAGRRTRTTNGARSTRQHDRWHRGEVLLA